MSRSEEFRKSALYHGTTHPFEIGDIIEPRQRPGGFREPLAFAAEDPRAASVFAAAKALKHDLPPRLFNVEPLEDDETHKTEEGLGGMMISRSKRGFRVTGKATPTEKDPLGNTLKYTRESTRDSSGLVIPPPPK
jgi:hypothetical protein